MGRKAKQLGAPPPSRAAHTCLVCGSRYSRREYVVRHVRRSQADPAHAALLASDAPVPFLPAVSATSTAPPEGSPAASNSSEATMNEQEREGSSRDDISPALDTPSTRPNAAASGGEQPLLPLPPLPQPHLPALLLPSVSPPRPPPITAALEALGRAQGRPLQVPSEVSVPSSAASLSLFQPQPPASEPLDGSLAWNPSVGWSPARMATGEDLFAEGNRLIELMVDSQWEDMPRVPHYDIHVLPGTEDEWEEEDAENASADRLVPAPSLEGEAEPLTAGFWKEPSFYPDHLFESEKNVGTRFFFPRQRFCVAWHYPWEVPSLPVLSRHASRASSFLLTSIPLTHRPTISTCTMEPTLAFALAVAGAGFSNSSVSWHNEMVQVKRYFAAEHLKEAASLLSDDQGLGALQCLLLYNILGIFHEDEEQRALSLRYHPDLIQYFKSLDLPQRLQGSSAIPSRVDVADLDGEKLDQAWRAWSATETRRRVAFLCYLLDLEMISSHNLKPSISTSYLSIDLPAPEALWSAHTATEWRTAVLNCSLGSLSLSSTLNALLSADVAFPATQTARLLATLPRQSPFTLAILTNALLSLRARLTASQQLVTSANSPTLSPEGELEMARQNWNLSLEKVRRGLNLLSLAGANETGRWWRGVQPLFK
ncbi:hypothetical protein BCR35DRAFT_298884 [Leucosporidium creatinivorum]|uniref:Xylanolytic transcriptional activator regulatory domain-containing protein n=1 Tax=Leucosporidium creatinivorum TaxID=106004 RepID=A0A1Y2G2N9_9BASI|nr:hypothetical protein BCR35DRAFT_298884 [Leucosporidium creatinivorum]